MYSSIMAHLNRHKILSEFQHGFRKQGCCETQLLLTIYDFTTLLEAGEQLARCSCPGFLKSIKF